jgi:hypothetical protein
VCVVQDGVSLGLAHLSIAGLHFLQHPVIVVRLQAEVASSAGVPSCWKVVCWTDGWDSVGTEARLETEVTEPASERGEHGRAG